MCDLATETLVKDTVKAFVEKGYMFTAWDVTNFLRKAGEKVNHHDVNGVVKLMYANSEMSDASSTSLYARATKDIGAPVAPFVYYNPNSDVNDYDSTWIDNNPNQDGMRYDAPAPAPVVVPAPVSPLVSSIAPIVVGVGICAGCGSLNTCKSSAKTVTAAPVAPIAPVSPVAPVSTSTKLPKGVHKVTKEGRLEIPLNVLVKSGFKGKKIPLHNIGGSIISGLNVYAPSFIGSAVPDCSDRIRIARLLLDKISKGDAFEVSLDGNNSIVIKPYLG